MNQLRELTVHSPVQEVRNMLYDTASAWLDIYEGLPGEVPYPFAYIADQENVDVPLKRVIWGRVNTTLHFYHYFENRADIMALVTQITHDIRSQRHTEHFYIAVLDVSYRTSDEKDNGVELVHVVLDVDIQTS